MMRALFFIACAGSVMPFLTSCAEAPKPAVQKELGPWPDDGWKPPPMHTFKEQMEIMKRSRHVCEFTDKGKCAGWVKVKRKAVIEYQEGNYE